MRDEPHHTSVGGYRVGRRIDSNRFLGHLEAPTTVELVFLGNSSERESSTLLADAIDMAVTEQGERVAIMTHRAVSMPRFALETPPELASAWEEMRHTLEAGNHEKDVARADVPPSRTWIQSRVAWIRSKPLVVGLLAGGIVLVVALALWPSGTPTPTGASISTPSAVTTPSADGDAGEQIYQDSPGMESQESDSAIETGYNSSPPPAPVATLVPESVVGDVALVALPSRAAAADGSAKLQVAVLERDGSTWRVREVY